MNDYMIYYTYMYDMCNLSVPATLTGLPLLSPIVSSTLEKWEWCFLLFLAYVSFLSDITLRV